MGYKNVAHIWLLPRMAGWRWMCTMARHGAPWRSHFSGTSRNSTWPVLACLISGKVIYTHTYMYLFLIYIYICNIYIYTYTKCRIFMNFPMARLDYHLGQSGADRRGSLSVTPRSKIATSPPNLGWWVGSPNYHWTNHSLLTTLTTRAN